MKSNILTLLTVSILPILAYADSSDSEPTYINDYISYNNSQTYVDLNLGYMNAPYPQFSEQNPNRSPYNLDSQSSMSFNGNVGYYFNPYLGAEVGFTYANINYSPSFGFDGNHSAVDVAAKGVLPLAGWLALYGKAGGSYNTYYTSNPDGDFSSLYDTGFGLLLGAGVQFRLAKDLYIQVEDDYTFLAGLSTDNEGGAIQPNNPNNIMAGFEFVW